VETVVLVVAVVAVEARAQVVLETPRRRHQRKGQTVERMQHHRHILRAAVVAQHLPVVQEQDLLRVPVVREPRHQLLARR
jgi:hypothetical protein